MNRGQINRVSCAALDLSLLSLAVSGKQLESVGRGSLWGGCELELASLSQAQLPLEPYVSHVSLTKAPPPTETGCMMGPQKQGSNLARTLLVPPTILVLCTDCPAGGVLLFGGNLATLPAAKISRLALLFPSVPKETKVCS